jgi:hypothetical protein
VWPFHGGTFLRFATAFQTREKTVMNLSRILTTLAGVLGAVSWASNCGAQPTAQMVKTGAMWDISGIVGTGQSLSVGAHGLKNPTIQIPGHHLQLSTGTLPWPVSADDPALELVPLKEPIGRPSRAYPSSWPENIDGETYHGAMASQLTALTTGGPEFVSIQGEFGEDGQGMVFLKKDAVPKGVNGRSYAAVITWTQAVARLAKAQGKTFGVGAVVVTHGETDCGNAKYEDELLTLWQNYNTDIKAITGQTQNVQMILSQQNSLYPGSAMAVWNLGKNHAADIACSGPKYQYPYANDSVHLTSAGYEQLGEKYAEVYYERIVRGQPWEPLQPVKAQRQDQVITVTYHVPVGPLAWDDVMTPPHQSVPEWKDARGFEITTSAGAKVAITSVAIDGERIVITCGSDPGANAKVGYAMTEERAGMRAPFQGTKRWGLLHDSDPLKGAISGKPQPNYSVAFEMVVP